MQPQGESRCAGYVLQAVPVHCFGPCGAGCLPIFAHIRLFLRILVFCTFTGEIFFIFFLLEPQGADIIWP